MSTLFRFISYLPIRNAVKQGAFFKRFKLQKGRFFIGPHVGNQRGQAVIEYVLMLVIIVSLVLGLRGVFSSMNNFMSNIMGEYISCLMEFGELPSLGVGDSELKAHETGSKQCRTPNFSAAAAFGAGSGGGSGGTGSGGGSNSSGSSKNGSTQNNTSNRSASKNSSDSDKNNSSSNSDASGGAASGRVKRNNGSGSSTYARNQMTRAGGASTADGEADTNSDGKIKAIEDQSGKGGYDSSGRSSRRGGYDRGKYKAVTGNMASEIEQRARGSLRKPGAITLLATDEGYRPKALKRTVNPPEFKEKVDEQKTDEFSFGHFFKWLVIAGIVIACFILFGGQVLNYSNSDS